jgi:hypothetical protein
VAASLEGKKLTSFTGVGAFVKQAFENSLSAILNKRQVGGWEVYSSPGGRVLSGRLLRWCVAGGS